MGRDDFVVGFLVGLLFLGVIFVWAIIGAAFGALAGLVLSWTPLGQCVIDGFNLFGLNLVNADLIKVGAALGFAGGFFVRTYTRDKKD